jgi:precorrin-3B synthase
MSAQSQRVSDLRRGWCPGALTPMETGDGWLVRVRPRDGAYSLAQLTAMAEAAHHHGNGEIDLTSRANLQIRGLSLVSIAKAQAILSAANLIDETPAHEAARNILIAPLTGIDPTAFDVRPLSRALEAALLAEPRLQSLPSKFNFAVDGGGQFPLASGLADITLRAAQDGVAIELAGSDGTVARVKVNQAGAAAVALARAFVEAAACDPSLRRMRHLVKAAGAASVIARAGLAVAETTTILSDSIDAIGLLGPEAKPYAVGIGLPFGRISAPALLKAIAAFRDTGITEVRPAPGRILVVPLQADQIAAIQASATDLGLITSVNDPRLAMDVCPGAPACERGTTHTRADAEQLARLLPANAGSIHISGCAKGCARQSRASLTFVARDGCYDLITNGTVSDTPARTGIASAHLAAAVLEFIGGPCG